LPEPELLPLDPVEAQPASSKMTAKPIANHFFIPGTPQFRKMIVW
jgi:hypothetical protein